MKAVYAFCFARAERIDGLDLSECGWEDPISLEIAGDIAAVASDVPLARFTGPEAERRLADLEWLLPRLQAHDRVIARVASQATAFPLRFGTLYSSRGVLVLETLRRREALGKFLAAMDGCQEYAVKLLLARERAIDARRRALFPDRETATGRTAPSDASDPAASARPVDSCQATGRGYLTRQLERSRAERALAPWLDGLVHDMDRTLRGLSKAVLTRPAVDPAVANWACLVHSGEDERLPAAIDRLAEPCAEQGVELHCSGPWPLYSFCGVR